MPVADKALVLTTANLDVSTSTAGAGVTCGLTGTLGSINNGNVCMARLRFAGVIEHDNGDELIDIIIDGYDGTNWYALGIFPRVSYDTATKWNYSNVQSNGAVLSIPIVIPHWVTQLRWRSVVAGTFGSGGFHTMTVWLDPTNFIPSAA